MILHNLDDKWIDSIRDKMAEYDFVPPDGLLESVQAEIRGRRIKRMRLWVAVAASVAVLVGIFVALIPDMPEVAPRPLVSDAGAEDGGSVLAGQIAENRIVFEPLPITRNSTKEVLMSREADPKTEIVRQFEPEESPEKKRVDDDHNPEESVAIVEIADSHSKKHSSLSVGISASATGLGGIFDNDNMEGNPLLASASVPHTRMGGGFIGESHSNDMLTPTYVELFDHRLPIRASIDFSWPVGHCISVGTGLTYSYLKSDIRYGYSDSPLFKATQNLHFIGIPLNVRYTPWSFRKLDIYVSAGFMAEKCIAGQIKETDQQYPVYRYDGCDSRPFQLSFNASAGLQYSLTHNCAAFIEPGVGIYLKNGSRLRTIYSERPVTFNINVGLRFGH